MIIKENNQYISRTQEGDRVLAWIGVDGSVITEKIYESNQIFGYWKLFGGRFGLNEDLIPFLKKDGFNKIIVIYSRNNKHGKVIVDLDSLLSNGTYYKCTKKPYDFQFIISKKDIEIGMDNIAREIYDGIWDSLNKDTKQKKSLKKYNPQKTLI